MAFDAKKAVPPPAKRAPKPKAPKPPSAKMQEREDSVNGIFQTAAFACIVTGQHADAGAISQHGPNVSRELAKCAEDSEPIANVLDYLNKVGPYTGLVIAVMPLVFQIAVNHGLGNASAMAGMGVVSPDALKAQVEADMAREASRQIQAQQEAQAQLQRDMDTLNGRSDTPLWDDVKTSV